MFYLFDMDGVLVLSSPVTLKAVQSLLSPYGKTVTAEDLVPFVGAGEEKLIAGVAEKHGVPYRPTLKEELFQAFSRLAPAELKEIPNAALVVKSLAERGEKIALASSADMAKVRLNMESIGIDLSLFSALVTGEEAERKKPDPAIFLKAAEKLGARPEECLVIEDAVNGIQAARAAGMKVVALTGSFTREVLSSENPDFIIDDLLDVLTIQL